MKDSQEFEEVDIEELHDSPPIKPFLKYRHKKHLSDTVSTSTCTFEPEHLTKSNSKLYQSNPHHASGSSLLDVAERLTSFRQITENKIKFKKLEKDLQELEECTFRPKINIDKNKAIFRTFSKKQLESRKKIAIAKLKKFNAVNKQQTESLKKKKSEPGIHNRLFNESKLVKRKPY